MGRRPVRAASSGALLLQDLTQPIDLPRCRA